MFEKIKLFILLFFAVPSVIFSEDLKDIYELALNNDPLLKSAEASFRAGKESKRQGIAALLPSLSVSGSTNWNESRIEETLSLIHI